MHETGSESGKRLSEQGQDSTEGKLEKQHSVVVCIALHGWARQRGKLLKKEGKVIVTILLENNIKCLCHVSSLLKLIQNFFQKIYQPNCVF